MGVNVTQVETDAEIADPNKHRSRVPGLDAMRATSGFQRGMLIAGLVIIVFFVVVALFASLIAPYGFNDNRGSDDKPFGQLRAPSAEHLFGTTSTGTDVFSQVVFGARTALEVIVLAVLISIVVGVPLGLLSGYLGGWLDRVLVLISDALFAFPSLLLAIIISTATGGSSNAFAGILAAAISITVVYVPQYFRVVRNATVTAREETYVEAARALGAPARVVMTRYIFGNVVQTVPVIATLNAGDAILTLAGLGFLGYGIEPSAAAEWGHNLSQAIPDVTNEVWWTSTFPGLAIVLIVIGVTLVGESLNDVLNPLLRTTKVKNVIFPRRPQDDRQEATA